VLETVRRKRLLVYRYVVYFCSVENVTISSVKVQFKISTEKNRSKQIFHKQSHFFPCLSRVSR